MPDTSPHELDGNEAELLRQLAQGHEPAFGAIYGRYQGPIFRFCWHMGSDPALAEDVTQEVFMHLIRNPGTFDPSKGSLGGYLFGIARNLVRRSVAQSRWQESLFEEDGEFEEHRPVSDGDLLSDLSQEELLESLRSSVRTLPEPYREAVVLCDIEEMSYPEAAVALGCSPGTIASRLHRGRSMLKARLTQRSMSQRSKNQGCAR